MPSPAVDDQPRVQETTNSGTSHASPRFARKGQQIGYRCNEMPQNSSKLKQRNLPPSTEVRINTVIESVQGNMFLITQNNSEKKVTDGKQDHRVLLEDWYRFIRKTMLNTITLKSNLQMSDQMRLLKRSNKTARNLPKTPIVAVIEMSQSYCSHALAKNCLEQGERETEGEQETTKKNVTTEYTKLSRKIARSCQPPETKQIKGYSIHKGGGGVTIRIASTS